MAYNYRGYQIRDALDDVQVLKNGSVKFTCGDDDGAKRWVDKQWARAAERHNKAQFEALNGGQ